MNGNNKTSDRATDLLDRVLAGKTEETKARVLELVLRLGISPDDELFLILIALGYLQTLIEDTPQDWQTLFHNFKDELELWTSTNIEVLDSLVRKAEHEKALAENSQQLVNALTVLTTYSTKLHTALQKQSQTSSDKPWLRSYLSNLLKEQEASLNRSSSRIAGQLRILNQRLNASPPLPTWVNLLLFVIGAATLYNTWMLQRIQ